MFRRASADVWSIMFEPFEDQFNDYSATDTIIEYPHSTYTNSTVGDTYLLNDGWRHRLHSQFSKLKIRREVLDLADTILPEQIGQCIGILYRGEKALAVEQRTGVLSSPEAICERVDRISRQWPVFVCADSREANERFGRILGGRMLFWEQADRCERIGQGFGPGLGDDHLRKTLAMVLALSRTQHFVHGISNMATGVLYINPWLLHTFVETTTP